MSQTLKEITDRVEIIIAAVLDLWHKLSRIHLHPMQYIFTAGLVVLLVMAWIFTGPLFWLCDRFFPGPKPRGQSTA